MFPAGNGDAILLNLDDTYILVDGGYTSTFRDHLKPRLKELSAQGKKLSRFVVTHIDADHITGAITFLEENGSAADPKIIPIDEVWFNSYRHLQFDDKQAGQFEQEKPKLTIPKIRKSNEADNPDELVGYDQGSSLGSLLIKHGYNWNTTFGGKAVKADTPQSLELNDKIRLTLFGPATTSLDNLAKKWREHLQKEFKGRLNEDAFFDDALEWLTLSSHQLESDQELVQDERLVAGETDWVKAHETDWGPEDTSLPNGSSITFLIECNGKKLLFLGDAIPGQVVAQLNELSANEPIHVDVVKVAHHGAWSNNSPEIFAKIKAGYYLISTNGIRHRHPHLTTLSALVRSHNAQETKKLVFNYKQQQRLDEINLQDIQSKYNFQCLWPDVDEFGNGRDGYFKLEL